MITNRTWIRFGAVFFTLWGLSLTTHAFTLEITGKNATPGTQASSRSCELFGEAAFSGAAGNTMFTNAEYFSNNAALQLTIDQGSEGFGSLGGIIDFSDCASSNIGTKILERHDEIWIRARFKFPEGFEFNRVGRNKFMRLRTFRNGNHEGYNDLYIDGHETGRRDPARFHFIFEGGNKGWASFGGPDDFFDFGNWTTVEYYVKFDDVSEDDGGQARIMMWLDGELMGDTTDRVTLAHSDSYVESFYFFTWWGNGGSHKTQSFYVDDLMITTDTPADRDAFGNPYIGASAAPSNRPNPPTPLY